MALNCKPGDLVILTRATNPVCIHMIGQIHVIGRRAEKISDSWRFEPEVIASTGRIQTWKDNGMRPIRDNPGQDETLQWAPVPHKEAA